MYIVPPPASRPPRSPSSLSSGRGSELTVDAAIRVSHSAGSGKSIMPFKNIYEALENSVLVPLVNKTRGKYKCRTPDVELRDE